MYKHDISIDGHKRSERFAPRVNMVILTIISHDVALTINDVREGLTHRYFGLYANVARYVLKRGDIVFWYSAKRRRLYFLTRYSISSRNAFMATAIAKTLRSCLIFDKPIIVLIDYPHSFLGIKYLLDYILTLLLLHLLRFLTRRIIVVVDDMDPPIEHTIELCGKISVLQRALWLLLNHLIFRFDLVVFHSQSYRAYHKLYYGLDYRKTTVVPPGSFPEVIPYIDPPNEKVLTILASGHIAKWIGIEKFKDIRVSLLRKGIDIKFVLIDRSASSTSIEGIEIVRSYLNYEDFVKTLARAHILIIIIRPRSLHHLLTIRASLADYLMSGRPVIYLHSLGMREIVKELKGCFELKSIDELPDLIARIVKNKTSLKDSALAIRFYAERSLHYRKLALRLLKEILLLIKTGFRAYYE